MTTECNIEFERLCATSGNFPALIPDIHVWLMGKLKPQEIFEGTFARDHKNGYRSHDPRSFNRQSRYAIRRYKNYVVGFVEDWDTLYEFLPDRVYRHTPMPHHLYPTPPTYDFLSRAGLSTSYVFYRPANIQSVYHQRLKLTSEDDLTPSFEVLWVHQNREEELRLHTVTRKLYQDGTFGATNGQLIRDIEDVLRSTTRRLFPDGEKLNSNPLVNYKGGYWWRRVLQEIADKFEIQKVVKLRNDFEAFDPCHTKLVEIYMKAIVLTRGGNTPEWAFDEFLVKCVKLLTGAAAE